MTTRFCEECGGQVSATTKFCATCGRPVGGTDGSSSVAVAVPETRDAPRAPAVVEEVRAVGKAWTEVRVGATSVVIRRKLSPPLEIPFAEISRIHSKLPGRMNGYLAFETARGGRNPGSLGVETELRHVRFIVHFGHEAAQSIEAVKRAIEERTELLRQRGAIPAALFFAVVFNGAGTMSRSLGVPIYLADVIQGTALMTMVAMRLFVTYRFRAVRHA